MKDDRPARGPRARRGVEPPPALVGGHRGDRLDRNTSERYAAFTRRAGRRASPPMVATTIFQDFRGYLAEIGTFYMKYEI